jgi:hypothetical protein
MYHHLQIVLNSGLNLKKGSDTVTDVKWNTISGDEWEKIAPAPKKSKESPYDELLQSVIDGEIVALPIADEKDVKGVRIGVARRASSAYQIKLAFRYDASRGILAIRLDDTPERISGETPTEEKRKPGRPRKQ